ncbi:MAG: ROK family protein [Candidatus Eisenbacteria bacterium]
MRIGVDLGGTKIEAVALASDGAVLARERVATPRGSYDGTIEEIVRLVRRLESGGASGRATVGIGTPGAISPATGRIKNANSTWLNDRPLREDLERALERPVKLANDANCFALSEAIDGAAAGARVVFGVILGTGVGGGVVIDGAPWIGPNAIAGEWGHNPLPAPDPAEAPGSACYCGRTGCIETFLSGPGLERDFANLTGERLAAAEIVRRATEDGSGVASAAHEALARYEDRLARALGTVINLLDPDVIVLGGGMSNTARLYETIPRLWSRYVFSDRVVTVLRSPRHGDSGGVRGAAWLWNDARSGHSVT